MDKIIITKKYKTTLIERFGRYVYFIDTGCWTWRGARNDRDYGVIGLGSRDQGIAKAHRVSYELFTSCKLNPAQCVCHICDNPPCVNPHHLFIGSRLDNFNDMVAKGRHKPPPVKRGEESPNAKLNISNVHEIRKLSKLGFSASKLAKMFGVSKTTILMIVHNKSWRHVT